MRDYDVHILMLGVGLECCTAIHLPEETIAEDLYVLPPDTGLVYPCRDRSGLVHEVRARRHRRLDRDFTKFATPLAGKGRLRAGWIGDHPWSIVRMADLLREVFAALIDNAEGTLRNG
jgi:aminoglycoside N3'-acetyltransferase